MTIQYVEDACFSFFTDLVMNTYGEVPWGIGFGENGTEIDSTKLSGDLKSGEVVVSYTLEDAPHNGINLIYKFNIYDERIGISEILADGIEQEIPEDSRDSVLIWILLDINYKE